MISGVQRGDRVVKRRIEAIVDCLPGLRGLLRVASSQEHDLPKKDWRTPMGVQVQSVNRRTPGGSMSRMTGPSDRARKVLGSLVVIGMVGAIAGLGAYSAFTSTTTNPGNSFA